jgi:16S rRNA G966 N2-methylase RsmD
MRLSISREYANLLPRPSDTELESLKQSIALEHGQGVPIIVNQNGVVLDGHNRYRACKELAIPVQYSIKEFDDPFEEKKFVIEVNLTRRHINDFKRAEIGYTLERIEAEKAKGRQIQSRFNSATGKEAVTRRWKNKKRPSIRSASRENSRISKPVPPLKQVTRTSRAIANTVDLSHATYERCKKIIIHGNKHQKNALRNGKVGINKIYRQIRDEEIQGKIAASYEATTNALPGDADVRLYCSDFRLLTEQQTPSESVDLIFTDPPDNRDSLPIYQDLTKFANKSLKEGASLVWFSSVGTVSNFMRSNNLQYCWQMCVELKGSSIRYMHKYKVRVRWKPLLWFVKGPVGTQPSSMTGNIRDLIVLKPTEEKKQSTVVATHIIKNLSIKHQLYSITLIR